MSNVLVVATSQKTRGGIPSVINAHMRGEQWKKYHCYWLPTHLDRGALVKVLFAAKAFVQYMFMLPKYDIVHLHPNEHPSDLRKLPFMWLAKVMGKKTVVHFHAFSPDTTINGSRQWTYRYLFTKADVVIALSNTWKKAIKERFPESNVVVIYNPCTSEVVPDDVFTSERQEMKKKEILYAGTVYPRKGYMDMIKAFAKIAKQHPDWNIVFAGNGEIEQGKKLAKELGIENQTKFLGWVSGMEKDKVFKQASIFCLPSYAEGFPMAVLDAWSYGLPVITTPVGGMPDVARHNENMMLFEPGDNDELAKCMDMMISDKALRDSIVKASVDFAENTFNIHTINKEVGELYAELLNNTNRK